MMKKKLVILCIFLMMFGIVGCTEKKENTVSNTTDNGETKSKLMVGKHDLTLVYSGSFGKLNYKYPENTGTSSLGTYTLLISNEMDENNIPLFKIGLTKFDGKSVDEAMNSDKAKKLKTVTYNNIEWTLYEAEGNFNVYATEYDGDAYTVNFISYSNISKFEEEFMKTASFS